MPTHRIIANPVRLTGSLHPQQLSSLVAIDAMLRRRELLGEAPPEWELSMMSGDVAVERAVHRAVARAGDDKDELGRDGFLERAKRLELEADADLRQLFDALDIQAGTGRWRNSSDEVSRAARVAFVRLYEAGVLSLSDAVLDSCPSCETVVDLADADQVELPVQFIRVSLPLVDGSLEMDLPEPELLVGAVAVAVPTDVERPDNSVYLPLLDADVPLVGVVGLTAPVLVVPGHDRWSHELARQLGYPIVQVLDADGVVRFPGPLEGLGRYAARAAATEQLGAEGFVTAVFEGPQSLQRCYRCGTVLVPLFGRHWILALESLVGPAIEAVQSGRVSFAPAAAAEEFVDAAQRTGSWCVSQQLWTGQPIPVATCLDCGQLTVSVEQTLSCGSCMGTLEPHTDVLDARFIAAVIPLAMMGWPQDVEDAEEVFKTLSVGRVGLEAWALPIAALGLRLVGAMPFDEVLINHMAVGAQEPGTRHTRELMDLAETEGKQIMRAALLTGDFDIERAKDSVDILRHPAGGEINVVDLTDAYEASMHALDAGGALGLLVSSAREGVTESSAAALQELARPLLSE